MQVKLNYVTNDKTGSADDDGDGVCVCQVWLQSYKLLFSAPCHKCSRLLVDFVPPTWRDFQTLEVYHEQCRPWWHVTCSPEAAVTAVHALTTCHLLSCSSCDWASRLKAKHQPRRPQGPNFILWLTVRYLIDAEVAVKHGINFSIQLLWLLVINIAVDGS